MLRALVPLFIVFMFFNIQGTFAEINPAPSKTQDVVPTGYPVMLGDRVLLYVRSIKAYPGGERAAVISGRIKRPTG